MSSVKAVVQVRNTGTEPIPLGGKYLLGGESRLVPRYLAEAAREVHAALVIVGESAPVIVEEAPPAPTSGGSVITEEVIPDEPQLLLPDEPQPEVKKTRSRRGAVDAG